MRIKCWIELPIPGDNMIEEEFEIEDHDDVEKEAKEYIDVMYQNNCPSGWEVVEE